MHVCHFCDTSVGGNYFKNMALGLQAKGVRVSMVELGKHNPPGWLEKVEGVEYRSLEASGLTNLPLAIWRLGRIMRRENVDILHTHLYFAGLIGVLATPLSSRTIVALMRHHTSVVRMLGSRFHILIDKWMAGRAERVITVSEAAREYMKSVDGIHREIEVVHSGFDFDLMKPDDLARNSIRQEFGFSDRDFVIGYVANFAPGKGQIELIEAFSKIIRDIPSARLLLVGGGILTEAELACQRAKLGSGVIFAGWREDVPACLNAMDLFVQPSLSEAFSQVLIEAMGVGLPVIATDVGGAYEVIENGVNGILIEPSDTDAIAEAVIKLYKNPETASKMAIRGRTIVRNRFNVKKMVERQFELYEHWLAER